MCSLLHAAINGYWLTAFSTENKMCEFTREREKEKTDSTIGGCEFLFVTNKTREKREQQKRQIISWIPWIRLMLNIWIVAQCPMWNENNEFIFFTILKVASCVSHLMNLSKAIVIEMDRPSSSTQKCEK